MTLYQLTDQFLNLLNFAEDPDIDPEILADTMDAIDGEIEVKADGYAKVIRHMESDMAGIKAEEERLHNRRKSMENNIRLMKEALQHSMQITGKTKFKTELFSFGIQKNPPSVVMDEQYIENIPEEYLIMQEPKLDRAKIKEDLKAGKDLEGIAHLEQGESLRIR